MIDDDDASRLREQKEAAWEEIRRRSNLDARVTAQALRLLREVCMAGYCAGRIDQLLDEENKDDN